MSKGLRVSARGPIDESGAGIQGNRVPFTLDDARTTNKDQTILLHKCMERNHRLNFENTTGIRMEPLSKEAIEKRALSYEWQTSDKSENEPGGSYLYETRAELMEQRKVDADKLGAIEKKVWETRAMAMSPTERRQMEKRGIDDSNVSGLIGVDYLHDYYRDLRLAGKMTPLFSRQVDIPAGYATHTYPIIGDMQPFLTGALTTDAFSVNSAANPTATSLTLTPKKLQAVTFVSGELNEDSLAPIIPALQESGIRGFNVAMDHCIISGDTLTTTANINGYAHTALGSLDPRLAFDGLRAINYKGTLNGGSAGVFKGVDGSGSAASLNNVLSALAALGKYGDDPSKVFTVMPTSVEKALMEDTKARPDTYWALLTAQDGKLQTVGGSRVITVGNSLIDDTSSNNIPTYATFLNEGYPVNLDAYGRYSGTGNTKTGFICFREDNFVIGWKRHIQWRVVELPLGDQFAVTMSIRFVLNYIIANQAVSVGFDVVGG